MTKKILVIPPTQESTVRKRLREIAYLISNRYEVYILYWSKPGGKNIFYRVSATLRDIFRRGKVYKKNNHFFAQFPFFHRPFFMVKRYNQRFLEDFLINHKIDVVINGVHYFFFTPKTERYRYAHIFDVNDLPTEETKSALGSFIYEFAKQEAQKADAVVACSKGLVDYVQSQFHRQAYFIPNGAYIKEFSNIDAVKIQALRRQYGLLGKFVITYIGHIGDWIDMDFLLAFFKAAKMQYKDLALMIVGSGPDIAHYKRIAQDRDIIFTGGVLPDKIVEFFVISDLGVLPSRKNLFQDLAFHIKLVEYTASRKMVISSDLEEVRRLGFPNILISELNIKKWLTHLRLARSMTWDAHWDNLADEYSWEKIAQRYTEVIEMVSKRI